MRVGNYWDESQVAIVDFQATNYQSGNWGFSAPAIASSVFDKNGKLMGVVFVETVPGSEHFGPYINPTTLRPGAGNVVTVNIWDGVDIQNITHKATEIWPLEWFGLKALPAWRSPAIVAYEYAMGVIGP